jgi:hypothetical protein
MVVPVKPVKYEILTDLPRFNHSAIPLPSGGYLFVTRNDRQSDAKLWFGKTDDNFKLLWDCQWSNTAFGRLHDPRLYWLGDQLRVVVAGHWGSTETKQCDGEVVLDEDACSVDVINFQSLKSRQAREKNWIPFDGNFFYDFDAQVRIDRESTPFHPAGPPIGLGLRGSSNLVPYNGKLLTTTHSWVYHPKTQKRVYSAYFHLLEGKPPYKALGLLRFEADEAQSVLPPPRNDPWVAKAIHSVIFPMVLFVREDRVEVITGINDNRSVLLTFDKNVIDEFVNSF